MKVESYIPTVVGALLGSTAKEMVAASDMKYGGLVVGAGALVAGGEKRSKMQEGARAFAAAVASDDLGAFARGFLKKKDEDEDEAGKTKNSNKGSTLTDEQAKDLAQAISKAVVEAERAARGADPFARASEARRRAHEPANITEDGYNPILGRQIHGQAAEAGDEWEVHNLLEAGGDVHYLDDYRDTFSVADDEAGFYDVEYLGAM